MEFKRGLTFGCGFFITCGIFIIAMLPIIHVMLLLLNQYVYLVP